jgi:hypothetical protein
MSIKATAPDANRMTEKLAGSIAASPSARLQSTEFAANATSASPVWVAVCIGFTIPGAVPRLAVVS